MGSATLSLYTCFHLLFALNFLIPIEAGILPLFLWPKTTSNSVNHNEQYSNAIATNIAHRFAGYIEYQPNGTVILRSSSLSNNDTNQQSLLLFKTILKAIKVAAPFAAIDVTQQSQSPTTIASQFNIKIYGDGIEHKLPPFLERIIQRIQTYFSVYRYTDTSRPVQQQQHSEEEVLMATTTADQHTQATTIPNNDVADYDGNFQSTTTFVDGNDDYGTGTTTDDDYAEFISVGEENNDGFISVGED